MSILSDALDAVTEQPRSPAFAYIDLARLGRTDVWAGLRGFCKILGWVFLANFLLGFILGFESGLRHVPVRKGPLFELGFIATTAIGLLIGLRGAVVKSQCRPLSSLFGPQMRIELRHVAAGAALWLGAQLPVVLVAIPLAAALAPASLARSRFVTPGAEYLWTALLSLALLPLQSAIEELVFRGWLTQTLGQAIRRPWLVAAIVGVLFALAHGLRGGWWGVPYFFLLSVGFSWLTFTEGRIELAIGAHALNNILVVAVNFPFIVMSHSAQGVPPSLFFGMGSLSGWALVGLIFKMALAYLLLKGWRCWRSRRSGPAVQSGGMG